ncbi:MAG: hypothetical protein GKR89_03455 [Candidatus Latescibacteria bacterium]|nr:hypothetical protein [Candidatus Latescibacterota bacterium]
MKVILLLSTMLLACSGQGGGNNSTGPSSQEDGRPGNTPQFVPAFADSNLQQAVAAALAADPAQQPQSLEKLAAQNRQIADLTGIEALQNLTVLDLSDNQIQDIGPLTGLAKLTFLVLTSNQIEDISALSSLSQLTTVVLDANRVRNIGPLLDLPALNNVELTGNPLDETSLQTHLVALQDKEVEVSLNVFADTPAPADPANPLQEVKGKIAFGSITGQGTHIYLIDANGENLLQLAGGTGNDSEPAWSPDSGQLAIVDGSPNGHIWAVDMEEVDGGERHLIRQDGDNRSPAWSPDGTRIVFVHSTSATFKNIYIMDQHGDDLQQLTDFKWDSLKPVWSPDGSRIAFVSKPEGRGKTQIFTMAPDGSNIVQLTQASHLEDKRAPDWGPDGRQLVLSVDVHPDGPYSFQLFKMLLDPLDAEDALVQLTGDDGYGQDPAWSPDGRWIAYTRPDFDSGEWRSSLFIVQADGSNGAELVSLPGTITDPSWAPGQ